MKLHFFTPPAPQRTGGLDAAIEGLRAALGRAGVEVDDQFPGNDSREHVVHFHGVWQPSHAGIAQECSRRGIPFLVSPHGMLEPWARRHKWWKKWPYFHLREKHFLRRAGALLATANLEAERLRGLFNEQRVETIPLGLTGNAAPDYEAARAKLGWRADERVLLYLSRIHVKKGLDLLLRALAAQKKTGDCRLVIVGGGDESYVQSLRTLADQLSGSLPRVDWVGEVWGEERWAYFQGADLFCLPSHSENFGLAVLEASQVGTPSITTVTTPWADYLSDGRGLICEPRKESVRKALARYFAGPVQSAAARKELTAWTRENFSWDVLVARYLTLYRSLL